ncbi:MAG: hypothetical protein HC898_06975 [Phycisphaerales bacterium]|nr:hypothetical protein [Phycisphaerales bacterium]
MLSTSAHQFDYDPAQKRITGLHIDQDRMLTADTFVSTLPFDRLAKISPPALLQSDQRLQGIGSIQVSPIIGIHLVFATPDESPIMDLPHLVVTGSMIQWLFNKGMVDHQEEASASPVHETLPSPTTRGQHLHAVISAAHKEVGVGADELIAQAVREVKSLFPKARQATLLHGRVVKEKRATFSARPGFHRYRAAASPNRSKGDAVNLYLAGDWCQTGWPATMEGAVRSGYLAAQGLLRDLGHDALLLTPDLPASPLYQFLAGE